ncbi:MAG: hypothetical protein ABI895_09225 [Deltaproteobacteria bacterium]
MTPLPSASPFARHGRRSTGCRSLGPAARRSTTTRGAAYVEAILLIFFMIIIFGGVIYLGRYFEAQQRALAIARRCAWAFSWNACVTDDQCGTDGTHRPCLPAVCDGVLGNLVNEPNDELATKIKGASTNAQKSNGNTIDDGEPQRNKDLRAGVDEQMNPFLKMVVGQSVYAAAKSDIERPSSLPDAESSIAVGYYLPCNLKHEKALPMAVGLFTTVLADKFW